MYESPIQLNFADHIGLEMDDYIFRAVQSVNVNVNKPELVRALRYDRGQYEKGYADAVEEMSKRVPKVPHGRLIDADALVKETVVKFYTTDYFGHICNMIDAAPTIIPAEEGET